MAGHRKNHQDEHHQNGEDELFVENLGTASEIIDHLPGSDGVGGLVIKQRFADVSFTVFRTSGVTFPNNDTGFCHIGGGGAITGIENYAQIQMQKCKVRAIRGRCTGGSGTFTIRKNGVDTTITGTVDATDDFFSIDGEVAFADKDLLSIAYSSGINWALRGIQIIAQGEVD